LAFYFYIGGAVCSKKGSGKLNNSNNNNNNSNNNILGELFKLSNIYYIRTSHV